MPFVGHTLCLSTFSLVLQLLVVNVFKQNSTCLIVKYTCIEFDRPNGTLYPNKNVLCFCPVKNEYASDCESFVKRVLYAVRC